MGSVSACIQAYYWVYGKNIFTQVFMKLRRAIVELQVEVMSPE
jgi:hypothetical protein